MSKILKERREGAIRIPGGRVYSRGNSQCKDLEVGEHLIFFWKNKVTGAQGVKS